MLNMKRRKLITLLGGATVAWPLAARAQQSEAGLRRIGVLIGFPATDPVGQLEVAVFRQELRKLGWIEGRNIVLEYRWAGANPKSIETFAKEVVALGPDIILSRSTPATAALIRETRSIPIVFTVVAEPVGSGFVASLARPGGNTTGFTNVEPSIGGKWVELLKQLAPHVARVGLIFNPTTAPYAPPFLRSAETAAASLAMEPIIAPVKSKSEIDSALADLARKPGSGLVGITDSFVIEQRDLIIGLAEQYRFPAVYPFRLFATNGGLMSYGADIGDMYRRAASYVDRILRGERPSDLPVQQPIKFELVINLKTAKTLGLYVPDKLLALADEVIE
jgi:putative tryptophan/tyrosine transport system substrate-binding protein